MPHRHCGLGQGKVPSDPRRLETRTDSRPGSWRVTFVVGGTDRDIWRRARLGHARVSIWRTGFLLSLVACSFYGFEK
jgi:hypothetical protein